MQADHEPHGHAVEVLGTDLGASFESQGSVIFLFGDSIGPSEDYQAGDTMASSTSTDPAAGLFVDFFTKSDGTPFFVKVPGVRLGGNEVPNAGIHLDNGTFVVCHTGLDRNLPQPDANAYSVLTRFDEATRVFTLLRTISSMPKGKFMTPSLHTSGSDVLMFGPRRVSRQRRLSRHRSREQLRHRRRHALLRRPFQRATAWSTSESSAVPIVVDNPLKTSPYTPSIGNVSVVYSQDLGLWLMTYDGGRQSPATSGVYFTYATDPWGPWSEPQLVFNPKRDGAVGKFIHDPSVVPNPPGDGLNGPTIGGNNPNTTPGGPYAPYMIERFTGSRATRSRSITCSRRGTRTPSSRCAPTSRSHTRGRRAARH